MKDIYINLSRIINTLESLEILGELSIERSDNEITIRISYDDIPVIGIVDGIIDYIDISARVCPILYSWAGLGVHVIDDMERVDIYEEK